MKRPRVLLADDHALLTEAFKKLLEPDCEVVGLVHDGRTLLDAVPKLRPDVVLLDISMPYLNGLDASRLLKRRHPAVRVIFLTVSDDPDLAAEAFSLGASGYLLKSCSAAELFTAIQEVMQGRAFITPRITHGMVSRLLNGNSDRRSGDTLTARQREVLQLLAEGRAMKEIATILGVTPRTVAFHKYRIMEELRLKSNADLIQFALKHALIAS